MNFLHNCFNFKLNENWYCAIIILETINKNIVFKIK